MRISDWSSDVCSSDLSVAVAAGAVGSSGVERDAVITAQSLPLLAQQPAQQQPGWTEAGRALVVAAENRREIGQVCGRVDAEERVDRGHAVDRKSTRLNSSH